MKPLTEAVEIGFVNPDTLKEMSTPLAMVVVATFVNFRIVLENEQEKPAFIFCGEKQVEEPVK